MLNMHVYTVSTSCCFIFICNSYSSDVAQIHVICVAEDVTQNDIETGRNLKPPSHNKEALWPLSIWLHVTDSTAFWLHKHPIPEAPQGSQTWP